MPKTVKVRIAVVVNEEGAYNAAGWLHGRDRHLVAAANEEMITSKRTTIHFITAEVPLPQSQEIAGTVEPGKEGKDG